MDIPDRSDITDERSRWTLVPLVDVPNENDIPGACSGGKRYPRWRLHDKEGVPLKQTFKMFFKPQVARGFLDERFGWKLISLMDAPDVYDTPDIFPRGTRHLGWRLHDNSTLSTCTHRHDNVQPTAGARVLHASP